MYYLQLESYNTLAMQVLSGQQRQSSSNSLYQQYTLTTLHATLKKLISCAYLFRATPKEQPYQGFTILRKNSKPTKFFGAMPRTPKLQKYVQYLMISCNMSSPVIETSRNSSYVSQESVITVSVMISLHTIQDVDTYKWSDTSTCQLDMYTHT